MTVVDDVDCVLCRWKHCFSTDFVAIAGGSVMATRSKNLLKSELFHVV